MSKSENRIAKILDSTFSAIYAILEARATTNEMRKETLKKFATLRSKYTSAVVEKLAALACVDVSKVIARHVNADASDYLAIYAAQKVLQTLRDFAGVYDFALANDRAAQYHSAFCRTLAQSGSITNDAMQTAIIAYTKCKPSTASTQCSSSKEALSVFDLVKYENRTITLNTEASCYEMFMQVYKA